MENKKDIFVYADWEDMEKPSLIGVLHVDYLRGKEIFSFEYDTSWLKYNSKQVLDPDLMHYTGIQYLNDTQKSNFGLFMDSSPDRWGRVLMRRREAAYAKSEGRIEKNLTETDYLLGVFDRYRMGGLRFKTDQNGSFLNNDESMESPPWASLRELEEASLRLEDDEVSRNPNFLKWINMLIAPGSSLGGARPKASISDEKGALWIAKFPSKNDEQNVGAWEMVTYELAIKAGITMSLSKAKTFYGKRHTFLSKRFDRTQEGKRIHFASAMTLLGYTDGQNHSDGVSYLELVDFISTKGADVSEDLEELWRRIVFSIYVTNTDDHLRNHGFLLTKNGWKLSPAYDINPVETGTGLKLNISENANALEIELAMQVIPYFRLSEEKALSITNEVKNAVSQWRRIAKKYSISSTEQDLKSRAFRIGV